MLMCEEGDTLSTQYTIPKKQNKLHISFIVKLLLFYVLKVDYSLIRLRIIIVLTLEVISSLDNIRLHSTTML